MSGTGRGRFRDLGAKRVVNAFKPFPRIRNFRTAFEIVGYLIADQIGMDHKKCGRQERPARFVIAAEEVLGQ